MRKVLAVSLTVLCIFLCSCSDKAQESEIIAATETSTSNETIKSSEIEITAENFDKFFEVYCDDLSKESASRMPTASNGRYHVFNFGIKPNAPGYFKNVQVTVNYYAEDSGWQLGISEDQKNIEDLSTGRELSFNWTTEIPPDFVTVTSSVFLMYYYDFSKTWQEVALSAPNYDMHPDYKIVSASGTYVPVANEDISSYQ